MTLTLKPMRESSYFSIGKIIYDVGLALARACEAFGESPKRISGKAIRLLY